MSSWIDSATWQRLPPNWRTALYWRRRTLKTYEDGEFEAFVERMKTATEEVEQLAAVIPAKRR